MNDELNRPRSFTPHAFCSTRLFFRCLLILVLAAWPPGCSNGGEPATQIPLRADEAFKEKINAEEEKKSAAARAAVRQREAWKARRRERERMVSYQIEARGIRDPRVLEAMREVPRHLFVPAGFQSQAYADYPLSIGKGQTISQPYIVALMTELLELRPGHKVLEIGTGSGYQAAILGELAREVYSIEIVELLGKRSRALLEELAYRNVTVRIGDGYQGWPEAAPFDAIIVTCAPDHVPPALLKQLRTGGRLVLPVGSYYQELIRFIKTETGFKEEQVIPVRFVPMTGEAREKDGE